MIEVCFFEVYLKAVSLCACGLLLSIIFCSLTCPFSSLSVSAICSSRLTFPLPYWETSWCAWIHIEKYFLNLLLLLFTNNYFGDVCIRAFHSWMWQLKSVTIAGFGFALIGILHIPDRTGPHFLSLAPIFSIVHLSNCMPSCKHSLKCTSGRSAFRDHVN